MRNDKVTFSSVLFLRFWVCFSTKKINSSSLFIYFPPYFNLLQALGLMKRGIFTLWKISFFSGKCHFDAEAKHSIKLKQFEGKLKA